MSMFRDRKLPRDWNDEPDVPEQKMKGSELEPGDMVEPVMPLRICIEDRDKVDGYAVTKPVYGRDCYDPDGKPTVDGELFGIYVGQKRMRTPRRVVHNRKHWTGSRKISNVWTMHHICIFSGRRVVVELDSIRKVQ